MELSAAGVILFLSAVAVLGIIYVIRQVLALKLSLQLAFGVKEDRKRSRGPKLLKTMPAKRKPRVIDESKLVKKES
jgi:hypothetical protein